MKRFVIGILTLALLLGAGIAVSSLFSRIHQPAAETLAQASASAATGDWEQATRCFHAARQHWEDHRRFTAAFADHEPMEEIDGLFAQGTIYAQIRDDSRFPALCVQLSQLTQAMADSHRLAWWTLL